MKDKDLQKWIKSLSKQRLQDVAYAAIDHLIESDDVRLNDYGVPYWEANGEELDE